MKCVVVGAGGVGGYFGGRLAAAGHDVALVARGPHLAAIRERGLRVRSILGDVEVTLPASDDPAELGPCDVVLFCVKAYDSATAVAALPPLIGADTVVLPFLNGIEHIAQLAALLGPAHVAGGAAYIFSSIAEPGVVVHTGGPARLVFGELDGRPSARLEGFGKACRDSGVNAAIADDIRQVMWSKLAFICATAGMTAAVRLPLGDIRQCAESWLMYRHLVEEVVAVARAEGVPLGPDDVDEQVAFATSLAPDSYSSLHHDLVSERPMELDALHGAVLRLAAGHGLEVPATEAVYRILRPWAVRNAGLRG